MHMGTIVGSIILGSILLGLYLANKVLDAMAEERKNKDTTPQKK